MAVLWLFCPEIGRGLYFFPVLSMAGVTANWSQNFQGFPGVEWWLSPLSVPSFFCAFTSMALQGNASVPTSQHHCNRHKRVHTLLKFRVKSQTLTFKVNKSSLVTRLLTHTPKIKIVKKLSKNHQKNHQKIAKQSSKNSSKNSSKDLSKQTSKKSSKNLSK